MGLFKVRFYILPRATLSLKHFFLSLWNSSLFPDSSSFFPKGSGYIHSPLIFFPRSFKPIHYSHNPRIHPWASNILPWPQVFFLPWASNILPWVSDMLPQAYNILICFPSGVMHLWKTGKELNDIAQYWQTLPQILKIGKLFPDDYRGIM